MDDSDDLLAQAAALNRSFQGTDLFNSGGFGGDSQMPSISQPPVEVGNKVYLVNRPSDLCLGFIYGGQRVCLAGPNCTVASHQPSDKKWVPTVVEPFLLVARPTVRNAPTAYVNPALPTSLLEDDLKDNLMSSDSEDIGSMLNTVWSRGIRHNDELETALEAPKTVRRLIAAARSPEKITQRTSVQDLLKRLSAVQSTLTEDFSAKIAGDFMVQIGELSSSDDAYTKNVQDSVNYLSRSLEKLSQAVRGIIQSLSLHTNLGTDEIKMLNQTTSELNSSLEQVSTSLSKHSAEAAGITEPSLWSFASSTRTTQDNHKNAIESLLQSMTALNNQMKGLQTQVKKLVQVQGEPNRAGGLDEQFFGASTKPHSGGNPLGVGNTPGVIQGGILPRRSTKLSGGGGAYASGEELEGIRVSAGGSYFGNNSAGGGGGGDGNAGGGTGNNDVGGGSRGNIVSHDGNEVLKIWDAINNHETRISTLERRKKGNGSDSVFWRGHAFHSPNDTSAWFEKHVGPNHLIKFGCFANPYQLMDECTRRMTSQFKSTKEMKEILALQLRAIEVRSYLSLDSGCNLPYLFASAERLTGFTYVTKPSKTPDARFQACPSALDFATLEDTTGIYPAMITALKTVRAGIEKDISLHYSRYPAIEILATQMLMVSVSFVEDVLSFMSQTHASLVKSFKGDHKAWDCVCKSIEDLWISQLVPATAEMALADLSDRHLFSILCMWTSLKIAAIAEEISGNKISSHPDITLSYVRFLIDHVGASQTLALTDAITTISTLRTELTTANESIASLKGQLSKLESRMDKENNSKKKKINKNK